jgi:hypothetical protein
MSSKPVGGITFTRWWRRFLAVILAWNLGTGIYDLAMGRVFGLISFACVLGLTATMAWQTKTIHRVERANRPRPDYGAIAAMEREVYGETFEHEGAPAVFVAPPPVPFMGTRPVEHPRPVRYVKPVKPPKMARCYCNYCRGRSGVHNADAVALYRAECDAAMQTCDKHHEHRSNLRWERPS